jgi:hypothetical protein
MNVFFRTYVQLRVGHGASRRAAAAEDKMRGIGVVAAAEWHNEKGGARSRTTHTGERLRAGGTQQSTNGDAIQSTNGNAMMGYRRRRWQRRNTTTRRDWGGTTETTEGRTGGQGAGGGSVGTWKRAVQRQGAVRRWVW